MHFKYSMVNLGKIKSAVQCQTQTGFCETGTPYFIAYT